MARILSLQSEYWLHDYIYTDIKNIKHYNNGLLRYIILFNNFSFFWTFWYNLNLNLFNKESVQHVVCFYLNKWHNEIRFHLLSIYLSISFCNCTCIKDSLCFKINLMKHNNTREIIQCARDRSCYSLRSTGFRINARENGAGYPRSAENPGRLQRSRYCFNLGIYMLATANRT